MNENETTPSTGRALLSLISRVHALNRFAASLTSGHSPTHYRVLGLLKDRGSSRIGDLAAQVHLSQPGMTKTVNLLEEHGYVEKQPDAADSRAVLVSLTDAGADALAERTKDVVRVLLPELGELSESERRTLDEAARILGRHLDGRPRAVSAGTTSDQIARTQEKQESTESE